MGKKDETAEEREVRKAKEKKGARPDPRTHTRGDNNVSFLQKTKSAARPDNLDGHSPTTTLSHRHTTQQTTRRILPASPPQPAL